MLAVPKALCSRFGIFLSCLTIHSSNFVFCQGIRLPQCLGPKPWSWPVCSDQLSGPAIYLSSLACGVDPPTLVSQSAPLPAAVGVRTCQRPTRPNVSPSACSSTPGSPSSPLPVSIRASTCRLSTCWPCWAAVVAASRFFSPQVLGDTVRPRSQHVALPGLHLGLHQELRLHLTIGWLHLTTGSARAKPGWSGQEASPALRGEGRGGRAEPGLLTLGLGNVRTRRSPARTPAAK